MDHGVAQRRSKKIILAEALACSGSNFTQSCHVVVSFILYYVMVGCLPDSVRIHQQSQSYAAMADQNSAFSQELCRQRYLVPSGGTNVLL